MGYCGCMGYEAVFPANQLGGLKNVWNLREYGVCEPWVTRESTVVRKLQYRFIRKTVMYNCHKTRMAKRTPPQSLDT